MKLIKKNIQIKIINKLIKYEKFLHLVKNKKKKSMGLTNFSKYNYIIENNIQQKEYLKNLLQMYKDKGYDVENIEYKKNNNIFNNSILLDHKIGEDFNKDVQKYGINQENKRNFIHDNKLLLKFNDLIHESRSPNAKHKNKFNDDTNKYAHYHFNYILTNFEKKNNNKNKKNQNSLIKNKIKLKKKKKDNKNKTEELGTSISLEGSLINANNNINNPSEINENNNTHMNSSDKIIKNNSINETINKDEENNNNSKIDNTITTYYGNDSLIFNESKNNIENQKNYKKESNEIKVKTRYTSDTRIPKIKFNISEYNNLDKKKFSSKYLLTSSNKTSKEIEQHNLNNNYSQDKELFHNNSNKSHSKQNLKLCLPEIKPSINTSSNVKKTFKRYLTNNKINFPSSLDDKSNKIKKLKKMFSKGQNKSSKSNFAKNKYKEVNDLFSTINYKSNIFENFPFDRVSK
jgi:hypothetical protein